MPVEGLHQVEVGLVLLLYHLGNLPAELSLFRGRLEGTSIVD